MDQKRLPLFIAISFAILLLFQYLTPRPVHRPPEQPASQPRSTSFGATAAPGAPGAALAQAAPPPANAPRVTIDAPRVAGSISLLGARLDDLRLRDYHETVAKDSPLVRILEPLPGREPASVQFGWSSTDTIKLPDDATIWSSSGGAVTPDHPVTLSWDNGAGLTFQIAVSVDRNYMFSVVQSVRNIGAAEVKVWPWQRARRDYQPATSGYSVLFEGLLGVTDKKLHTQTYASASSEASKHEGEAYTASGDGGWSGFGDKYWLTALIPDQSQDETTTWNHTKDGGIDHYQVSYASAAVEKIAPGGSARFDSRVFAGAKEVHVLDRYETKGNVPLLSYAVDWGWFAFLTKPFFYALDWLYDAIGNFGVAILVFTLLIKTAFYPIAANSYKQMGKMRLLGPKIQAVREKYKEDPAKLQSEMMSVYKAENVSPVSGCLPMLLQIPVFFALYKVILINIEMRQAPFFGWIQDLSAIDPTNIFNLFGLIPFDPGTISPFLHLGVWPMIMGLTMYLQQKLNPPPPDPTQARMLQFMPLVLMFTMGRFPAGLVIYWSWNNLLTLGQQWFIQRQAKLTSPGAPKARAART
jgi:YidC/Oxa1 family membrane protein insertase